MFFNHRNVSKKNKQMDWSFYINFKNEVVNNFLTNNAIIGDYYPFEVNMKASEGFGGSGNYEVLFFSIEGLEDEYPENKGLYKAPETTLTLEIDHFLDPMSSAIQILDKKGNLLLENATDVHAVESENIVRGEMGKEVRENFDKVKVNGKEVVKDKNNNYILKDKKDYAKPTNKTYKNFDFRNVKLNKNESVPKLHYRTQTGGDIYFKKGG